MVALLILLYALNANGIVPDGCFIAAWILAFIRFIVIAIEYVTKPK